MIGRPVDRLDELLVLSTVLEVGSLAGAARRLRKSPPAITRSLAALEERVGVRLIQRTTRQLAPTASGQRLAVLARQLLTEYEQAVGGEKERKDAPIEGLLKITAPTVFGRIYLAPLVRRFTEKHPGARIELVLSNRNLNLVEEGMDVGIRIGRLTEAGLVARRVGSVHSTHVASPAYLARRGRPRRPEDLAKHDVIFVSQPRSVVTWKFRGSEKERAVRLIPRFLVSDVEAAITIAKDGGGIARCMSYQVVPDLAEGSLVRVLQSFDVMNMPVHLVTATPRRMSRVVRTFLDIAGPTLSALPIFGKC